jgi:hypothetical protein
MSMTLQVKPAGHGQVEGTKVYCVSSPEHSEIIKFANYGWGMSCCSASCIPLRSIKEVLQWHKELGDALQAIASLEGVEL